MSCADKDLARLFKALPGFVHKLVAIYWGELLCSPIQACLSCYEMQIWQVLSDPECDLLKI
ncbi:hypothetical protein GL58_17700 [Comamonas testosteroni]|uniref:Uncharacterized protein n=1 Tax=Comamonas testosteroni TaxID=285 RepID=A0A0L7N919_COMTE|nr:hypothetical protein GL58_17700 [Comamonas testosteroni]